MSPPLLSILIPTINERESLPFLLDDLACLNVAHEVIVADGGSTDATCTFAARRGAVVVHSRAGRGMQLASAARMARAPVLCVLHADVRLPAPTVAALDSLARTAPLRAMAFSLRIDDAGAVLALVAGAANVRSRLLGLPYGDQGLVLTRSMYDAAGGFEAIPIMEDVAMVRALARTVGVSIRREYVIVSPRRWRRAGVLRQTLTNAALLCAYLCGMSPHRIRRWYAPEA